MKQLFVLTAAIFGAGATAASAQSLDRNLTPLAALIGVWDTEDSYESASGAGVERGVRTCAPAFKGKYIECITIAPRRGGGEREYRFSFSWDEQRKVFTLVQMWSDYPGLSVTTVTPAADGRSFDLRTPPTIGANGTERRSWGALVFESPNQLVWTGRANVSSDPPDLWKPVFREVSRRRQ